MTHKRSLFRKLICLVAPVGLASATALALSDEPLPTYLPLSRVPESGSTTLPQPQSVLWLGREYDATDGIIEFMSAIRDPTSPEDKRPLGVDGACPSSEEPCRGIPASMSLPECMVAPTISRRAAYSCVFSVPVIRAAFEWLLAHSMERRTSSCACALPASLHIGMCVEVSRS